MSINPVELLKQRLATQSQREIANDMGISPGYLSEVLSGKKGVGDKVLDYLGLQIRYVRATAKPVKGVTVAAKGLAMGRRGRRTNGAA